jgi:hypothetical protein
VTKIPTFIGQARFRVARTFSPYREACTTYLSDAFGHNDGRIDTFFFVPCASIAKLAIGQIQDEPTGRRPDSNFTSQLLISRSLIMFAMDSTLPTRTIKPLLPW